MAPDDGRLDPFGWECASTPAGAAADPDALSALPLRWIPAPVPGTVAGALRQAGVPERTSAELDGEDWWFRCHFASPVTPGGGAARLLRAAGRAGV